MTDPSPDDDTPMDVLRQQVAKMFAAHAPRLDDGLKDDTDEPDQDRLVVPKEGSNPAVDRVDQDTRQWVASIFDPTRFF